MAVDWTLVAASVAIALAAPCIAGAAGFWTGRKAAESALSGLRIDFDTLRAGYGNLVTETRENMERSHREAQRATAARSKAAGSKQAAQDWTPERYQAHLEQTGQRLPEVESALFPEAH